MQCANSSPSLSEVTIGCSSEELGQHFNHLIHLLLVPHLMPIVVVLDEGILDRDQEHARSLVVTLSGFGIEDKMLAWKVQDQFLDQLHQDH